MIYILLSIFIIVSALSVSGSELHNDSFYLYKLSWSIFVSLSIQSEIFSLQWSSMLLSHISFVFCSLLFPVFIIISITQPNLLNISFNHSFRIPFSYSVPFCKFTHTILRSLLTIWINMSYIYSQLTLYNMHYWINIDIK